MTRNTKVGVSVPVAKKTADPPKIMVTGYSHSKLCSETSPDCVQPVTHDPVLKLVGLQQVQLHPRTAGLQAAGDNRAAR